MLLILLLALQLALLLLPLPLLLLQQRARASAIPVCDFASWYENHVRLRARADAMDKQVSIMLLA